VHSVVSLVAQDGLYLLAGLAVVVWLLVPRNEKAAMAVEMVVGLVTVAILVKLAGALHSDPRPFVQDPSIRPWFPHPPDNGFPSDHTAVAVMTSSTVLYHRRTAGLVLLAIGAAIGAARVLAHVHHVQDVVAGGVIGLAAAVVGILVWRAIAAYALPGRAGKPETGETASQGSPRRP
jgi:membrane-associated phospholipid phosphatase